MAERRMFAKTIIDSDAFLEMPQSTQLLYFHLSMRADDDGFINKPRAIMRTVGAKDDDLAILGAKKFIIPFECGIVVIKHWKIHNYIAKDRYTETKYKEEKASLGTDENGAYTTRIQGVNVCATQVRLGEVREGKDSIGEEREDDGIDASATPSPVTKNDVDKPKPDKKPKKQISPEEEAFRADLENKKLYHAINDPILEKAQTFCNYGREGEAVWQAVHKLKEKLKGLDLDPFDTVCNMVSTYLELTDSGKDFWVEVTPTKFASCFEKVWAESQKSSGFSLPDDRRIDPSLIR